MLNLTLRIYVVFIVYNYKMSRNRSRKGKSSQIPAFITKLLQMVENTDIRVIISWTSTADSFNIKNISKFTDQVLPQYFKHRNFSSFIRQLNMYGFRKIRHADGQNVYMHEHFRQGSWGELKHINRKIRQEKDDRMVLYEYGMENTVNKKQLQELKSKQKNLEQLCRNFFIQNQKLMEENQNLIKKMEFQAKQREKRLEEFLISITQKKIQPQSSSHQPILLSITEEAFLSSHGLTPTFNENPIQTQNAHLAKVRSLLQQLYQPKIEYFNREQVEEVKMSEGVGLEQDDNGSFMSINDFINADDYQNGINLQESL